MSCTGAGVTLELPGTIDQATERLVPRTTGRLALEGERMGLIFRRRVRMGRNSWLNLSNRGASVSQRVGRVTMNSRGGIRVRLGRGLSWRIR